MNSDTEAHRRPKRPYGRGYIRQRAEGVYNVAVSMGRDRNTGKYVYKWTTVRGTRRDAERKLTELQHQLDTGVTRSLHVLAGGKVVVRQPKTAKARRMIVLSALSVSVLSQHREKQLQDRAMLGTPLTEDVLIFSKPDGRPFLPNTVTHAWIKLVRRTGLKPIRLHDARHSHASIMLKQGTHPKVVQERLGHASIQITLDTYSHVAPGIQEAAAARFDQAFTLMHNGARNEVDRELIDNILPRADYLTFN